MMGLDLTSEHNPYAPPNASLGDEHRSVAPRPVAIALGLLAAGFGLAVIRSCLMKDWSRPLPAAFGVLLLAAVCWLWWYALWRRRKWVWWITVVGGFGGIVLAPLSVARLSDPVQKRLYWVQLALTVPAVIMLVLPAARQWYRKDPAIAQYRGAANGDPGSAPPRP
jgi:peptidoglycan/LPS O-acetylase OafA/YrhL